MSLDRAELRRRRAALRAELKQRRTEARAALEKQRQAAGLPSRRDRRRRRLRRGVLMLVALILALLLLQDCSCHGKRISTLPKGSPLLDDAPATEDVPPPPPLHGRVSRRDRPTYESAPLDPLPWLEDFRLQVAARSPRLAECMIGSDGTGTLRWTVSVEPASGQVSAHTLEPMLAAPPLTSLQHRCLIDVLSQPPYRLPHESTRSTPSRVGMVLEF